MYHTRTGQKCLELISESQIQQVKNTTCDNVINSNTCMNSVTTTSLPTHIKQLHQHLEPEQNYMCIHEFNTYFT